MTVLELSVGLALLASVCSGLQAIAVEYGLTRGNIAEDRSPALAAAVISIVVSVLVFWGLFAVRGLSFDGVTLEQIAPFVIAGLGNPAAFRLVYFRGIDRIGARITAAVVSANPAIAAVLAVPILGEPFTVLTGVGLLCIVAGGIVLQVTRTSEDESGDLIAGELAQLELRDLVFPVTAMLMLGGSFVLVKIGLNSYPNTLAATTIGQTAALVAFLALFAGSERSRRRVRVQSRVALASFTLAGIFVAANWLAWFSALQLGTVVTVVPLANVYPLVIVVLSYGMARQLPKSPRILGAITAIIVGASVMQIT